MSAASACPVITVQKGIPFPPSRADADLSLSEIILKLKKGESFFVAPSMRARVLNAAIYLKSTGKISFKIVSRTVNEGGIDGVRCWRVEE